MKAVLQYRASTDFRRRFATLAPDWLNIVVVDEADKATFASEMQESDVLLRVLEPVTAAVIAAAPKLRLIQKIGVGVNTIDLMVANERGIAVANMPGTNSQAVAEMALTSCLRPCDVLSSWTVPRVLVEVRHCRRIPLVAWARSPDAQWD
jgi:phosphoglycerate dehydrogenase-like enzyme